MLEAVGWNSREHAGAGATSGWARLLRHDLAGRLGGDRGGVSAGSDCVRAGAACPPGERCRPAGLTIKLYQEGGDEARLRQLAEQLWSGRRWHDAALAYAALTELNPDEAEYISNFAKVVLEGGGDDREALTALLAAVRAQAGVGPQPGPSACADRRAVPREREARRRQLPGGAVLVRPGQPGRPDLRPAGSRAWLDPLLSWDVPGGGASTSTRRSAAIRVTPRPTTSLARPTSSSVRSTRRSASYEQGCGAASGAARAAPEPRACLSAGRAPRRCAARARTARRTKSAGRREGCAREELQRLEAGG